MEIRFDKYRIKSDRYQYSFQEFKGMRKDKKDGMEEKWDSIGHFATLDQCVTSIPDYVLRLTDGSLQEAIGTVKSIANSLEMALAEAGYPV